MSDYIELLIKAQEVEDMNAQLLKDMEETLKEKWAGNEGKVLCFNCQEYKPDVELVSRPDNEVSLLCERCRERNNGGK